MAKEKTFDELSGKGNQYVDLPLNGKLITSMDGSMLEIGDFQVLKNMRYGDKSPKSITGMTKINTAVVNATYLKPRRGFHFRKYFPAESHILLQSWNTGLTAAKVYENTTAVPTAGDFTATEIWSDTASSNVGYFSDAPDGCMVYTNGKDTLVWGGNEYRCGAFIMGDLEETVAYDYTQYVTNTITTETATVAKVGSDAGNDANTVLLLNCDGVDDGVVFDDSAIGATVEHDATAVNHAHTHTGTYKFGTASLALDGTDDYITVADHADFDFSAGTWSIDMWVDFTQTGALHRDWILWDQHTDANNYIQLYSHCYAAGSRWHKFGIRIVAAAATVVSLESAFFEMGAGNKKHLEFTENGDNYYIFLNGSLIASGTDAQRPANYTGLINIGADSSGANAVLGYLDEIRASKTPRHTANFSVMTQAYSGTANAYAFIASTRPLKGIKFYVGTANTTACVPTVSYWDTTWIAATTLVDGTASPAGTTLGQTGSITFDTTVSLAKPRVYNNVYAYWYLVTFAGIDNTTTVYYVTLDAPIQSIKDLWDGDPRPIMRFYRYSSGYVDESTNVLYNDYLSTDGLTFSTMGGLTIFYAGFAERMTGIEIEMGGGTVNTTVCNLTVSYWDGDEWVAMSGLKDGTINASKPLGQSGTVTWGSPVETSEFQCNPSGSSEKWYFYKFEYSAALSATVNIDMITGITAAKTVNPHSYCLTWQNRVWLLDEYQGYRNSATYSATDTVCVFNGSDSDTLYFSGDEPLTCGCPIFTRFGGDYYDDLVVMKKKETWLIAGTGPSDYIKYQISDNYGCVAPGTLAKCDLGYEIAQGLTKHVLIWQAENAIVAFDGNSVMPISTDIENYFDPNKSECIPTAMLGKSEGFYDAARYEYHFLFASGSSATSLNKEFVYDLLKKKWFEVDRGTGNYLQIGFSLMDTYGQMYNYGTIDTGYMLRLEYGNTFNGTNIQSQFRTRDLPFAGWNIATEVRHIRLILVAKATSTAAVVITHYGDCILTSTETATTPYTVKSAVKRVLIPTESIKWGPYLYHSFNCSLTTSNEALAFEPIGIGVVWKPIRELIL